MNRMVCGVPCCCRPCVPIDGFRPGSRRHPRAEASRLAAAIDAEHPGDGRAEGQRSR